MIEILSNSRNIEFMSDMKNKLKDVEFLVPCFSGDSFIAVLVVGKKLSEDPYKDDEIDVFRILAPQIATVIERIQPYEKVKEDYVAAQAMADKAMEMAEKMAQQAAILNKMLFVKDIFKFEIAFF
jgi:signal transduction protein with GAF and PtsI domain